MKISAYHSHLGGWEYLQVRKPEIWREIVTAIESTDVHDGFRKSFHMRGWRRGPDFVKQGVAVEAHFVNAIPSAPYLFAKHLAFYVGNLIDVGVEILPMKSLQQEMSSGVAYYEGELYNLIREGRGVPGVPLVIIGIEC